MWRVIFSGLIEKSKGATLWKFGDFENNDAGKNPKVQRFYGATWISLDLEAIRWYNGIAWFGK